MIKALRKLTFWIFLLFLLPAFASLGWWAVLERPTSWRAADWSSANILPKADQDHPAVIHVMAARTGGLKGALSQHSWIVTKVEGDNAYNRYDKVGWGSPVRKNAYAADAKWYSNTPQIIKTIRGAEAAQLIPKIQKAIAAYPHLDHGGYRLWPGPNSNSFIAHILRQVPELGIVLPPNAVGRNYIAGDRLFYASPDGLDYEISLLGYAGVAAGYRSGIELNFLGLVTGIDIVNPALKLPGFGRIGMPQAVASEIVASNKPAR